MGYMKIPSLYQVPEILDLFRNVYCMEKINGTSAHILYQDRTLTFFSGGAQHDDFLAIFKSESVLQILRDSYGDFSICIYGEAYGGKMQGLGDIYGHELQFVVFDVFFNGQWLTVPKAQKFAKRIGLEFVPYRAGPASLDWVSSQRDLPSELAVIRGMGEQPREGVVIRPMIELTMADGQRLIAKHRQERCRETKSPREIGEKAIRIADAKAVAEEWVTANRIRHVLQKLGFVEGGEKKHSKSDYGAILQLLVDDIKAESRDEIEWTEEAVKEIKRTGGDFLRS